LQGRAVTTGRGDFEAWFRLLQTPQLGPVQARRLLATFGSPDAVLGAPAGALRQIVPEALATAIAGPAPESFSERLQRAHAWLAGDARRCALTLGDADYPARLLQITDPPLLLYLDGEAANLHAPSLAIVGSRHPTPQGEDNAREFASALSRLGWVVVSGLALGIDAAAHEGAMLGGSGTVAVLGCGLDQAYPASHRGLAARIVEKGGTLLSEYAPGTPALAENFPRRNRIIAGLSLGTLVVEAALRSGSLITARLASEGGREVFAIPGSIHSPQSKGCHQLLKQGAKLVEVAADILEELGAAGRASMTPAKQEAEPAAGEEPVDVVLRALGHDPTTLDALVARTGWPTQDLAAHLLELELLGQVSRLPGGLYQRQVRA
jgi:DNA processing protein